MPRIEQFVEIDASRDAVWNVISDLDHEPDFWWGTKEVRNISKEGNVVNREITQNFRNHKILQKVILSPKEKIEVQYLKGLTEGSKFLKLETMNESKQKLTAIWNVKFTGIYKIITFYLTGHVRKGTIDALQRIKRASEGTPLNLEGSKIS